MKNIKNILFIALIAIIVSSCNMVARNFGGIQTITLDPGVRLINGSFKNNDIWLLTTKDSSVAQTYDYKEYSNLGILQGNVIIKEQ